MSWCGKHQPHQLIWPTEGRAQEALETLYVLGVEDPSAFGRDSLVFKVGQHLEHLRHECRFALQTPLCVKEVKLRRHLVQIGR